MPRTFNLWSDESDPSDSRWSEEFDHAQSIRSRSAQIDWDVTSTPPAGGDRWTTWDQPGIQRGPEPFPDWLVTTGDAYDVELGVLKTGKEADAHLLRRCADESDCLLVAKRYRGADHTLFRNTETYTQARSAIKSRDRRALARGTRHGRVVAAGQWAQTEWATLVKLWQAGVAVPYPVSRDHDEILMEFIDDGTGAAAPRLVQTRPDQDELTALYQQFHDCVVQLARLGIVHGDLSPYNMLVAPGPVQGKLRTLGRLVVIDWPQMVDVVTNPSGVSLLQRDLDVVCRWFAARGVDCDADDLLAEALSHVF